MSGACVRKSAVRSRLGRHAVSDSVGWDTLATTLSCLLVACRFPADPGNQVEGTGTTGRLPPLSRPLLAAESRRCSSSHWRCAAAAAGDGSGSGRSSGSSSGSGNRQRRPLLLQALRQGLMVQVRVKILRVLGRILVSRAQRANWRTSPLNLGPCWHKSPRLATYPTPANYTAKGPTLRDSYRSNPCRVLVSLFPAKATKVDNGKRVQFNSNVNPEVVDTHPLLRGVCLDPKPPTQQSTSGGDPATASAGGVATTPGAVSAAAAAVTAAEAPPSSTSSGDETKVSIGGSGEPLPDGGAPTAPTVGGVGQAAEPLPRPGANAPSGAT